MYIAFQTLQYYLAGSVAAYGERKEFLGREVRKRRKQSMRRCVASERTARGNITVQGNELDDACDDQSMT